MRVSLLVALALLMTATVTTAQHHVIPNVQIIDGKEHPELIPDSIAYLNFFRANSAAVDATDEDRKHQSYKIRRLNLTVQDELQFRLEMANFRTKFDKWNVDYTKVAEKGLVQPNVFWAGVAKIVTDTRGNLVKNLGSEGHKQYEEGVGILREHTRYFTTTGGVL
jgi:hypothetical protein